MKFGIKDIVTDSVIFEDARDCRHDEKKCGYNGLYFEEVPNPQLKMMEVSIINFTTDERIMMYFSIARGALIYVLTIAFFYSLYRQI